MTYNLSFDYFSIVMLGIAIVFNFCVPKYKSFQNRLFSTILVLSFLCTVFDAASTNLIVYCPNLILTNRLLLVLYNMTQHSMAPLYLIYIVVIVHPEDIRKDYLKLRLFMVPAIALEALDFCSLFLGLAFRYDAQGYHRFKWFFIFSSVITVFYMLASLVIIFVYSKKTSFLPKATVLLYTLLTGVFVALQYVFPNVLLICSAGTVAVFSMYMSLQNPALLKEALEDLEISKQEAEKASESKSVFLANMSHEIRTPMNAICGMTYLLNSQELSKDAKEYVKTIQSASESLMSLINDILDFSKLSNGTMNLVETEYRLDSMVKDMIAIALPLINPGRVAFTCYIDPEVPAVVRGDMYKTRQILMNLLNNAAKFTEDGQISLQVTAKKKEDSDRVTILFRIKDTGIGIKPEDMGKLFATFEQVDMAKNRKKEGAGLGLALAKNFCEMMNGHIEVESTYGTGSTFTAVVEQEYVEPFPKEEIESVSKNLFVVLESNPYVRKSIEKTLKSLNVSYVVADDLKSDIIGAQDGRGCFLLFDYRQYGKVVRESELNGFSYVSKVAMVPYDSVIPEDEGYISVKYPIDMVSILNMMEDKNKSLKTGESEFNELYFLPETRVAIVDDNKVNLKVTSAILKKVGIDAKMFLSGYEILEDIKKGNEYDLIFMDHMMPDMDGVETTKRIRALKIGNCNKVAIVALTANAVKGVDAEFRDAGMNDTLFKPVNMDALREVLRTWLPQRLRAKGAEKQN